MRLLDTLSIDDVPVSYSVLVWYPKQSNHRGIRPCDDYGSGQWGY